jgi:hypothetical protein
VAGVGARRLPSTGSGAKAPRQLNACASIAMLFSGVLFLRAGARQLKIRRKRTR